LRAYATNSVGTAYSTPISFSTLAVIPVLSTTNISVLTAATGMSGGVITNNGGATITACGVCWSTTPNPTIYNYKTSDGTGSGAFTSSIIGLKMLTTYYLRAYATNSVGTAYGNEITMTTPANLPSISTANLFDISPTTASCGGLVSSDGGAPLISRGICWSTTQNPTITNSKTSDGVGVGSFSSELKALTPNTTYYLKAYATNSAGTGYGNELMFKTYTGIVSDIDGNTYYSVTVGNQIWMAENLNTTKYRNGDVIPNITDGAIWGGLTSGAYCNYNNDINNSAVYGRLYNWYAVSDKRNIAPSGWHVASNAEWKILIDFLGKEIVAGGKMREIGTSHWNPNFGATNESGFTALPGGSRGWGPGPFSDLGKSGNWWSSDEYDSTTAWDRGVGGQEQYMSSQVFSMPKVRGESVRCIKD